MGTLDGRISALDPKEHGNVVWSHETGPGPLLSSSLSRLEVRFRDYSLWSGWRSSNKFVCRAYLHIVAVRRELWQLTTA